MANPIAVPGTVVSSGAAVSPGGAQGPTTVSTNANNKATLGTDSLILVQGTAAGVAATTHAQTVSGDDPQLTTLASATTKGLLRQVSGNTTDFIDGTNNSQPLQPVIWSVRLRSINILGNSTFEVDQRAAGTSFVVAPSSPFGIDRWSPYSTLATGRATAQQIGANVTVPGSNFLITSKILRITVTTTQASLAAADQFNIWQYVEGPLARELFNDVHSVQILGRSSVANLKFSLILWDNPYAKALVQLCTLSATPNTWTLVQMPNLPSMVSSGGSFPFAPGGIGYNLVIGLAAGTTQTASNAWQTGIAGSGGATGQSNLLANAGATFDLAFAQHEPGALCTTPIDCPFTQNLKACQRYFAKSYDYGVNPGTNTGSNGISVFTVVPGSTFWALGSSEFPAPMAKTPTFVSYSTGGTANSATIFGAGDITVNGSALNTARVNGISFAAAQTGGAQIQFNYTADSSF